jgi:hypothetical protein
VGWLKHFHITLTFIYRRLSKDIKLIPMRRKIIRKKKENEAGETLSKIKGGKELEIAAIILNELAQRKKRKNEIDNKQNNLKEIKEKEKKTERPIDKDINMKNKRIKELENLKKMGIIKIDEFEKLKNDLID